MKKIIIFVLVLSSFRLFGMEADDRFMLFEWRSRRLQSLLEEAQSSTPYERNALIRQLKRKFVAKYIEKYNDQQEILSDLLRETGGAMRATTDPELAKTDSGKFLCIDPLNSTADEIDARWKCIHHEDCKYISAMVQKYGSYDNRPIAVKN